MRPYVLVPATGQIVTDEQLWLAAEVLGRYGIMSRIVDGKVLVAQGDVPSLFLLGMDGLRMVQLEVKDQIGLSLLVPILPPLVRLGDGGSDYSGFAEGDPVSYVGSNSPPCNGCQRVRQQISDSRGQVFSLSLGCDSRTNLWWCNGCYVEQSSFGN